MSGFGTDAMALACILGGAGAGIAGTVALLESEAPVAMVEPCLVESAPPRSVVVLSMGGDDRVPAPRIVVQSKHDAHPRPHCVRVTALPDVEALGRDARREMERAREQMMRARAEMERAREQAVRADAEPVRIRLRRAERADLERALAELERELAELQDQDGALVRELEAEMGRLELLLERVREDGGL